MIPRITPTTPAVKRLSAEDLVVLSVVPSRTGWTERNCKRLEKMSWFGLDEQSK